MTFYRNFHSARHALRVAFKTRANIVHPKNWQGVDVSKRPEMRSSELLMENLQVHMGGIADLDHWRRDINPNLPWADNHFEERICGYPINPGVEWENWPWASSADGHRDEQGQFNHNYMERLWPRFAGMATVPTLLPHQFKELQEDEELIAQNTGCVTTSPNFGIRGEYGDLRSAIDQLAHDPYSRQIVVPLFFPEDTGTNARKPCTLLYQFIRRENELHLYYPLRSCDFVRHWADDCYMAVRLLLWVIDRCVVTNEKDWKDVVPGMYTMHMSSLHVFENDMRTL